MRPGHYEDVWVNDTMNGTHDTPWSSPDDGDPFNGPVELVLIRLSFLERRCRERLLDVGSRNTDKQYYEPRLPNDRSHGIDMK